MLSRAFATVDAFCQRHPAPGPKQAGEGPLPAAACSRRGLGARTIVVLLALALPAGSGTVPYRLDLHATGGIAYPYGHPGEVLGPYAVVDIDARALLKKSDVKKYVPKKYRGMLGEEIYMGHLLVPNTFAFARNPDRDAWAFFVDWAPIGLSLVKRPPKRTNAARASFKLPLTLLLGYHVLGLDDIALHSPRPGLELRAEWRTMVTRALSLKVAAFQKGYIPDLRELEGEKRNIMPQLSTAVGGIVLHFYLKRQM
jgi:hypothetical protein